MADAVEQLVIIGSGPAGHTAALYAARANLKPVLFEGETRGGIPGGQLMITTDVENYPGFPKGIQGPELMSAFREQSLRFGTRIHSEDVTRVELKRRPFTVASSQRELKAQTLIIATGANAKRLHLPSEEKLWNKGISACAVCDGALPAFRNKPLVVIGGGDSAVEEATYLTKFASKVYVVHRRDTLRASKIMQERARANPKITFVWNSAVEEILDVARGKVTAVRLRDLTTGRLSERPADGLFIAIGHQPNTGMFRGQLELLSNDYVKIVPGTTQTSVPGVFAAGDVQDHVWRQAVTAAGTGCMAALEAERYLEATQPH